jgi:hypothetical protein
VSVESGVAAGDLVVHGQDSMLSCKVRTAVVQCRDFGQDFGRNLPRPLAFGHNEMCRICSICVWERGEVGEGTERPSPPAPKRITFVRDS